MSRFPEVFIPEPNQVVFGPKLACWVGTRVSQDLLKNIQWFQTYKCWIEDLSRDHHLGSILACNSTTVPSPSRHESVKKKKKLSVVCETLTTNILSLWPGYLCNQSLSLHFTMLKVPCTNIVEGQNFKFSHFNFGLLLWHHSQVKATTCVVLLRICYCD